MKALAAAGLISLCLLSGRAHAADDNCGDWSAVVLSTEGGVEIRRARQSAWSVLNLGDFVCLGDSVRALQFSRAALRLPGDTMIRVDEQSTLTFLPPDDENRTLLEIVKGVISVISRDPRALKITTPFANAGLQGTEFLVSLSDDRLDLVVYEGEVALDSPVGTLAVSNGQNASVSSSGVLRPPLPNAGDRTDLRWSLHYPRILAGPLPAADQQAVSQTAAFFARRAQRRISVGRIALAQADIAAALSIDAGDAEALAMQAMVAFAEGDVAMADSLLERALFIRPESAALRIVETYLLTHYGELRQALGSAERAIDSEPGNAIAHARHAEMLLALGDVRLARIAANTALSIDADSSPAHSALGFAALAEGERGPASEHFAAAARLDSAAPLPRLGLAIALHRAGASLEGRDQLEAAVVLAANDGIVRSYMGKAYFDELRGELSATQLQIATTLDELDATPRVYQAVFSQDRNRPVAALQDLAAASAIGNRRATLRSSLLADEDLATRSAGLGRIYRSVGFERLALLDGSQAIVASPADAVGHRLVADVYSEFPRFEMVRTSENYQAQLLQPINVRPFAPQLSQINLSVANSIGPADLAYPEARTAFARNGLEFLTSAVTAGNGTVGENVVVAGLADNVSFNVGQFHLETDGFRENNDFEHDVLSAFVQTRPSSATSLQFELRAADIEKGDLNLLHDPNAYDANIRQTEESDLVRFGVSHRVTTFTTIVGSLVLDRSRIDAYSPQSLALGRLQDEGTAEFQVLNELPHWNLVSGFRALRASVAESTTVTFPVPVDPFFAEMTAVTNSHTRHLSSYVYATRRIGTRTYLTAGASVDRLDGQQFDEDQTNPKLGLSWQPAANTQLRIAYFQTLQGPLLSKQLIQPSLEPMQVAGFGQYVFGVEAESAKNYAFGFDQRLARNIRFGIDFRERSLDVPTLRVIPPSPSLVRSVLGARESIGGIWLYWTPQTHLAFNAGWQYEDFNYHGAQSPYGFGRARTKRVPIEASVFVNNAISARFSATHVDQEGQFRSEDPSAGPSPGASEFWVVDASMNYRLPKRLGSIEVGIKNLFDEAFRFQDTDPEKPHIFPERLLYFRLSFNF